MSNKLAKFLAGSALFLSGCVVGPLVSHETARTVGNSNHELLAGYGQVGQVLKWNYGLTENWDLGFQYEAFSIGTRMKYAFLNSKEGFSFAGAFGIGTSLGGSHYYGDMIASYLTGGWEPYGTIRMVHVKVDPASVRDANTGSLIGTITVPDYDYGQAMLGTRYWFTQNWLLSVEVSTMFGVSPGLTFAKNTMAGLAFGYRF